MSVTKMEQYVTSSIERRVPYNGPVLSDMWNDSNEELIRDITALQTLWNTLLYPLLGSLPNGPVTIQATERTGDVSPFDNGFDGTQMYMDMTSQLSDELYYDDTFERPRTIKESFEVFQSDVDDAIQEAKEAALLAGLTEDSKNKIGWRIFYTGRTSAPESLDGLLQRLDLLVDQMVADVFNEGFDADSPPDYASYILNEGLQSRDNTLMEYIQSLLYAHDRDFGAAYIPIHHVFVDETLEGTDDPQVISEFVKRTEEVNADFKKTSGVWPGVPEHLEDELNQLRTGIRRTVGWIESASDFDTSVALWTALPDDAWAGNTNNKMSLKAHIDRLGRGIPSEYNPHGLKIDDIDDYITLLQDAHEVPFSHTDPGSHTIIDTAVEVREALESLETAIETNIFDIGVLDGRVDGHDTSIGVLQSEMTTAQSDIVDLETKTDAHWVKTTGATDYWHEEVHIMINDTWKALVARYLAEDTLRDVLVVIDADLTALETDLAALEAFYADHIDGTSDRHTGFHIDFSSTTTEPLEYPVGHVDEGLPVDNTSDAINELQQLMIDDRIAQDAKINTAGEEGSRYGATNLASFFNHHYTIYVDYNNGFDEFIIGDGTPELPYKTVNRALQDVGKMVVPIVEIVIMDDDGSALVYPETVFIDHVAFEQGNLTVRGVDRTTVDLAADDYGYPHTPADPENVIIGGGTVVTHRIWFYGGGLQDMVTGGTYAPTSPTSKTTFYVQITTEGTKTYIPDFDVPESQQQFRLWDGFGAEFPDDDDPPVFTDTAVFALEIPWASALANPGEYKIDYKGAVEQGRVQTFSFTDASDAGTVDYYTIEAADKFRWWKDNAAPPADYDIWSSVTGYLIGDKVVHTTGRYECNTNHTNEVPPNALFWDPIVHPYYDIDITEEVYQTLDQGVQIQFQTDYGHNQGDLFFFSCFPRGPSAMSFVGARGIFTKDLCIDGGGVGIDACTVRDHSLIGMQNIIIRNGVAHGLAVSEGSHVRIEDYHIHSCVKDALHATRNSHIRAVNYDNTLDSGSSGVDVSGYGASAEWQSGIETCFTDPAGDTGATNIDAATFAAFSSTCWTTTSTTSTTSTSTSSTTTSTTVTTLSTTSTSSSSSTTSSTPPP